MKGDVDQEYLSPDLKLLRMYRLYKEKYPMPTAEFWLYRDILKQQNLCFVSMGYFTQIEQKFMVSRHLPAM
ncbi:hypothetical protein AAFF_G00355340 [Aldrovandia affinis]|uniref:Uncharacterized protein n=1 Tax=Aldrovandia affinis TaxID=143900 RepID=A0AAD7WND3_9TELE|nr:hypothetical protein AAFF_G00355340 [Aldrovandia affinis]